MSDSQVRYHDQQPLSLIDIPGDAKEDGDNQLTRKILEASERKLALIRKLLTTEEYDSMASKLLLGDSSLEDQPTQSLRALANQDVQYAPISYLDDDVGQDPKPLRSGSVEAKSASLQECLARRREAVEFFFSESDDGGIVRAGESVVAMELRSCYDFDSSRNTEDRLDALLADGGFNLMDRIWGLLSLLGITRECSELTESEHKFLERHKLHNTLPYNSPANLFIMHKRLTRDKEIDRVLATDTQFSMQEPRTQVVETLQTNVSGRQSKAVSGHFNCISILPAEPFAARGRFGDFDLLQYSSVVDFILGEQKLTPVEQNSQVDLLHGMIFRDVSPFDTIEIKLARIMNNVELNFAAQLLGRPARRLHFAFEPYTDEFPDSEEQEQRSILLLDRWIHNSTRLVHLSERENAKLYSLSADKLKEKIESLGAIKREPNSAHEHIEQLRVRAAELIQGYESQLEETIRWTTIQLRDEQGALNDLDLAAKTLLKEPALKLAIDVSGLLQSARRMVPRRTARRPLMPQRNRATNRWIQAAQASLETDPLDIEAQTTYWQRLVSNRTSKMRLVVTIQQASNIPMRVVQQPVGQLQNRPTSPFQSASSPLSFLTTPASQFRPLTPTHFLQPPTTYIEVVFQRTQQTSSLVHGKNPSWNETLFFSVGQEARIEDCIEGSPQLAGGDSKVAQLFDESLQLNLYDYNCFNLQDNQTTDRPLAMPGMASPTTDLTDPLSQQSIRASRLVATKQRVERHLLGSLRIPLQTILTNGRIQGSFPLSQPLFLDNYQFEPEQALASRGTPDKLMPETFLSLFITLDPAVSMPINLHLPAKSYDGEQVMQYARIWEQLLQVQYSRDLTNRRSDLTRAPTTGGAQMRSGSRYPARMRHVRALVLQSDARYCIISRLLTAITPPEDLIARSSNVERQMKHLARFVSLLSPLKYGLFNMRLLASNLWFDSGQLINKYLGGPEERAVLLCNYFLHLGKCSAIVMGDAIPEGRCVYVIVFHEQSRLIESQLQLQVGELLNTIGIPGQNSDSSPGDASRISKPMDRTNFLSSLPILINHKTVKKWDANSGRSYSPRDQLPLVSVGSIATPENVYANLQTTDDIAHTSFDIRIRNCWFPLLESGATSDDIQSTPSVSSLNRLKNSHQLSGRKRMVHLENLRRSVGRISVKPLISLSQREMDYSRFSADECEDTRTTIEKVVKANLLQWRPGRPTYFNRTLSRLLAEKLALFERDASQDENQTTTNNGPDQESKWRHELATTIKDEILAAYLTASSGLSGRQIISWPINVSYTSMRSILDSLYASGVHNADLVLSSDQSDLQTSTSRTQFLVACHVEPFPARVLSVWLYVAAIITKATDSSNANPTAASPFLLP